MSHLTLVHQAALLNLGGSPLVGLVVVLILAGIIYMIWAKVIMPLLANISAGPWLNIADWVVKAILIIWVLKVALEVIFGISLGI